MSKFKVKLKVTGFELEIEGSREDAAMLGRNVSSQLSGLMRPIDGVTGGGTFDTSTPRLIEHEPPPKKSRRRRPSTAKDAPSDDSITFQYDQERDGLPAQHWKTAEKALWLVYIMEKSTQQRSLHQSK